MFRFTIELRIRKICKLNKFESNKLNNQLRCSCKLQYFIWKKNSIKW